MQVEISATFVLLVALANEFEIDIEEAIKQKFFVKDSKQE